ncbi:PREDICTED: uncharacterized protein LOC109173368 [Ipomoea nil]|uniref:uncharacterized protein LOC109173368 n=1 Tax=Ipomoea nil TaxID=35883 RepID=UPI000901444F|nr:PREDICTED: uncharacterized protein LOC109173368 [Ipomoea nil]
MSVLVWNCQGAASQPFRRTLKQYLREHKLVIACLLEPRVSGSHANEICFDLDFDEWYRIECFGFSGGIWVLWKNTISVKILHTHPQFMVLEVSDPSANNWKLSVVYGSPDSSLRKELFSCLSQDELNLQGAWLVAGDFNAVTCKDEVSSGSNFSSSRCTSFKDWLAKEGLIDLGYSGAKFTWFRGLSSPSFKAARLDRAICSVDWRLQFPDAEVVHLPIVSSDHAPLHIRTRLSKLRSQPKKFRYNAMWATHPNFLQFVEKNWSKEHELDQNKVNLAAKFQEWNKNTFVNIHHRKKQVLARLGGVQRNLAINGRPDLIKLNKKVRKELEEILLQEELLWFQRSRENWITSGDHNTRFYHVATIAKKAVSKINMLKDEQGVWLEGDDLIRDHIFNHFVNLFTEDSDALATPNTNGSFPPLLKLDWDLVNRPFSPLEIKQALFDMDAF